MTYVNLKGFFCVLDKLCKSFARVEKYFIFRIL